MNDFLALKVRRPLAVAFGFSLVLVIARVVS